MILKLVNRRASFGREICRIKDDNGSEVFLPAREDEFFQTFWSPTKVR